MSWGKVNFGQIGADMKPWEHYRNVVPFHYELKGQIVSQDTTVVWQQVWFSQPINHSGNPLPGAESCHIFELLVRDPGWDQKLLRVAGAKPAKDSNSLAARENTELQSSDGSTKVFVNRHLIQGRALIWVQRSWSTII